MNSESNVKTKWYNRKWFRVVLWTYLAFMVIIVGVAAILGPVESETSTTPVNEKAEAKPEKKAEAVAVKPLAVKPANVFEGLSQDEAVKLAVSEAMNDDSYVKHYIEDNTLWLTVKLSDNFTANMMRKGGLMDSLAIAELVEKHAILGELTNIEIMFETELTDAYGNSSPDIVLEVGYTAETLAKINYDNVLSDNVPTIADYYWQHPTFDK